MSTAGDVNGDGFSDVIVGATYYSNGELEEGRASVYQGSASGLSTIANWNAESNHANAHYGESAASAGDVNGDGFSDVIVGAWSFSGEGRAFVYYGNEGDGVDRIVRQARTDDSAPISMLGTSDSETGFLLKVLGRTPGGRGEVRLQYEVKPFGVPFNGSGLVTGNAFDTGVPNPGIGSVVSLSDLASGFVHHTLYHWRLRIVSDSPFFPRSPWLTHSRQRRDRGRSSHLLCAHCGRGGAGGGKRVVARAVRAESVYHGDAGRATHFPSAGRCDSRSTT